MSSYLSDSENLADLVGKLPKEDQEVFMGYGHLRVESAFTGRLFVVYRPTGLNPNKTHKPPEILTTIRIEDFQCDAQKGATARIVDVMTGQTQVINHVPSRVFHHPIFVSIPPFSKLRWDARLVSGQARRSLSFAMLVKTRNRSDFYSIGNTYFETPNDFKALFPDCKLNLNFA